MATYTTPSGVQIGLNEQGGVTSDSSRTNNSPYTPPAPANQPQTNLPGIQFQDGTNILGGGGTSPAIPSTITSGSIAQTPSLALPSATTDHTNDYTSSLASLAGLFGAVNTPTKTENSQNNLGSTLKTLYDSLGNSGASVDSSGNLVTTGAEANQTDTYLQKAGFQGTADLQNQIDASNRRITGFTNSANAIPLQMENDFRGRASVGQINAQSGAALRENTIAALKEATLNSTLRGNLADAQNYAKNAVEMQFLPIQTKLNNLQAIYNLNKDTLQREDSKKAAFLQAAITERQNNLDNAREDAKTGIAMASVATKNFPTDTAAQFAAQQALKLDPSDPQYLQKVFEYVGKYQTDPNKIAQDLADLDYKRSQTALNRAQTVKTNAEATAASGITTSATSYNERSDTINLVNNILDNKYFPFAVGTENINPLNYIPGNASQPVKAQIDQLIAKLSLDNRSKLKGSGAISDFESRTLEKSASSFNRSLSEADAREQLKQIRGVLTTLNGNDALVQVKDPKTGETQNATANRDAINKMITDGLIIKYQ